MSSSVDDGRVSESYLEEYITSIMGDKIFTSSYICIVISSSNSALFGMSCNILTKDLVSIATMIRGCW
jgi:hypothetical protein